jgi:nitroreductase
MTQFTSSRTHNDATLQYEEEVTANRKPDYPIHPLILNRWSPRSYAQDVPLDEETLFTVLEAARWAPSGGNQQPWRFYVARSSEERELFQQFIRPRNRLWTVKAPVLILIGSVTRRNSGEPLNSHAFDAGAAWASLAFQARLLGLSTRAVGGFDQSSARELLQVPEEIELHAIIALGYRDHKEALDHEFQEQEQPNNRRPLAESILPIKLKA